MPIRAIFQPDGSQESFSFNEIDGYRIAGGLTENGFESRFFVRLLDRTAARRKLESPVAFQQQLIGTLQVVEDQKREYVFNKIKFRHQEIGVTRRERCRMMEFSYDRETIHNSEMPVSLENSDTKTLNEGELGSDYRYRLSRDDSNTWEHLLGFKMLMAFSGSTVMQFAARRNKYNSFLKSAIEMHNERPNGMGPLSVNTGLGEIVLKPENVRVLYVVESYGSLLELASPPISIVMEDDNMLSGHFQSPGPAELLRHEEQSKFESHKDQVAIEVATVVFSAGEYRDLVIT